MSQYITSLYDIYQKIFKDIKTSNKFIKDYYNKLSNNNYNNIDDIIILRKYLKNYDNNIKLYLNFLQELKDLMIKKTNGIYEKLEYLFKVTRTFDTISNQKGGSPKSNEIRNNFKKVYEEYENIFHNFKVFMYSTNTKILKEHENKIENLITIYSFIDHLINHLLFISKSHYNIREQLSYLETFNMIINTKTQVHKAIRQNDLKKNKDKQRQMLETIKEETKKIDNIILSNHDYPEQLKKEVIELNDIIEKSLQKIEKKYKPNLIESLHEKIIELLNSRKYEDYLNKNLEDKLLNIITKYLEQGYKSTLVSELNEEIVNLLNKDKNEYQLLDKKTKDNLLEIIIEMVNKLKNKRKSKSVSKK